MNKGNLYLVGMMGSGKTVTGKALARWMRQPFIDLDDKIEKKFGRSVSEIFQKDGEAFFRDQETAMLEEVSKKEKLIISTGGGIVLRSTNVGLMKLRGTIVYLKTSLEWLWRRLEHAKDRPLLQVQDPRAVLEKIFNERAALYESASDFSVLTDGKTADEVMKEILAEVN